MMYLVIHPTVFTCAIIYASTGVFYSPAFSNFRGFKITPEPYHHASDIDLASTDLETFWSDQVLLVLTFFPHQNFHATGDRASCQEKARDIARCCQLMVTQPL